MEGWRCSTVECRFYIKKFLLGVLVALGLLYAYFAQAIPPREFKHEKDFWATSVIYNSGGIPNDRDWEAYEERRKAEEARREANKKASYGKYSAYTRCRCVVYARLLTGFTQPFGPPTEQGWARHWPTNSSVPQVGAVVVFYVGSVGHVAVILDVNHALGYFTVTESNWVGCTVTTGRVVYMNDPTIKGYWVINR